MQRRNIRHCITEKKNTKINWDEKQRIVGESGSLELQFGKSGGDWRVTLWDQPEEISYCSRWFRTWNLPQPIEPVSRGPKLGIEGINLEKKERSGGRKCGCHGSEPVAETSLTATPTIDCWKRTSNWEGIAFEKRSERDRVDNTLRG